MDFFHTIIDYLYLFGVGKIAVLFFSIYILYIDYMSIIEFRRLRLD